MGRPMPASADTAVDLVKLVLIPGGILTALIGAFTGWKRSAGTAKPIEGTVVSATLADANAVRELVDAVKRSSIEVGDARDQRHRDSLAEREKMDELCGAIGGVTDVLRRVPLGIPPDMLALLARIKD